jgi:hypothetical protein|tara:strand:- start:415 stop:891 length:477 start_codon:yes stop_codon:yes gene_type:complete
MATTITDATLTVTITESVTLNGAQQGATNSHTVGAVNEVFKHIVTCTTDRNELFAAIASGTDRGSFLEANIRYIRITNKDDANHVVLFFKNESNDEFAIKVDAKCSFIYNADLGAGVVDTFDANTAGAASSGQLADLTNVYAQADTASCDLEIFVASV